MRPLSQPGYQANFEGPCIFHLLGNALTETDSIRVDQPSAGAFRDGAY